MKRCFAIACALFIAFGANAADFAASSKKDWSGPYIGGSIGYARDKSNIDYVCPSDYCGVDTAFYSAVGSGRVTGSSFLGGLEAGYNWQIQKLVFGVSAEFSPTLFVGKFYHTGAIYSSAELRSNAKVETRSRFALRTRMGWALTDQTLIFVTAGVSKAEMTYAEDNLYVTNETISFNDRKKRMLWSVGSGIEQALHGNWSAKAETFYTSGIGVIGGQSPAIIAGGLQDHPFKADQKGSITLRVGLNYRLVN